MYLKRLDHKNNSGTGIKKLKELADFSFTQADLPKNSLDFPGFL